MIVKYKDCHKSKGFGNLAYTIKHVPPKTICEVVTPQGKRTHENISQFEVYMYPPHISNPHKGLWCEVIVEHNGRYDGYHGFYRFLEDENDR